MITTFLLVSSNIASMTVCVWGTGEERERERESDILVIFVWLM